MSERARSSMADVSIIVVSWNARSHLAACLDSIRTAAAACVTEVIVVDNASTDGSPEMVHERYPEVRLIRASSNLGFAKGNNLAMAAARGSLFALVNSDALVHPGSLEILVRYLAEHPGVGLVGPRVLGADGNLQRSCRRRPRVWTTLCRALALDRAFGARGIFSGHEISASRHASLCEAEVLSGCFCLARRRAVEQIGGLDETFFFYGEDLDWCLRFKRAGWKLVFVPEATATHLGGGSSSVAPLRFSVEILRATLHYWRKHHGVIGQAVCTALLLLHHGLRLAIRSVRTRAGGSAEDRHKLREDVVCLRWLLYRKDVHGTG